MHATKQVKKKCKPSKNINKWRVKDLTTKRIQIMEVICTAVSRFPRTGPKASSLFPYRRLDRPVRRRLVDCCFSGLRKWLQTPKITT
jgi:hypothetical protein